MVMNETLVYIGSVMIIALGMVHIVPVKGIIRSFGFISSDNRKILAMEVISGGLTLIFLGGMPLLITIKAGVWNDVSRFVYLACGFMLVAQAVLAFFTSARAVSPWYKLDPAARIIVAILFIQAGIL